VLISYRQARDYFEWRSRVISEKLGRQVTYRLPSQEEWRAIAQVISDTEPKRVNKEIKTAKRQLNDHAKRWVLIGQENPKSGVHHLFSNVSEMTREEGVAMGSCNADLLEPASNLNRPISYDSPDIYLGFRCVAEPE
jgi:formylglycine-generating enzyme required for sulfatase activity